MKKLSLLKALALSFILVACLASPMSAQKSDGFFRDQGEYSNRAGDINGGIDNGGFGGTNGTINNQSFDTPLSGGLLILTAIGAGYITVKRKKLKSLKMKKLTTIIIAFALLAGLSQCKKNEVTPVAPATNMVNITLDATNGSKAGVDPTTGDVTFQNGDVIYVVSNGVYVGTLTHNGTRFAGPVSSPTENMPLYFYFFGNQTPSELQANSTTSCTFNIFDQTDASKMPVVSYGVSNDYYSPSVTSYGSTLNNQCALVKFNVTNPTGANTYIMGTNNMATVNFANSGSNPFTFSKMGTGAINVGTRTGEVWVIMLPSSSEVTDKAYSSDWAKNGTVTIPAITANSYYAGGINVSLDTDNKGTLPGSFTSDYNINNLHFSKGNLMYSRTSTSVDWSTGTWSFMEYQYNIVETDNIGGNYWDLSQIGLFGWGTSGWNNGNTYYQPYNTDYSNNQDEGYGYGPTNGTNYNYSLTGDYANSDWGVYNDITNGGAAGTWRTPTSYEWSNVVLGRTDASNKRGFGSVDGVNGLILLPDVWESPYVANSYTTAQWTLMEANGAVFLPAAGYREGGFYHDKYNGYQSGCYWSSDGGDQYSVGNAYFINFNTSKTIFPLDPKKYGCSVRLVRNIE